MKKMIWANFTVQDANRTNQFYTQLGFKSNKFSDDPKLVSFLFGDDEFVIHFFEQGSQIDEYLPAGSKNGNEIIFTLSANTEQEIEELAGKVKTAGGTIFKEPKRDQSGYFTCGFADPDGHRFNVLLMDKVM
jgi:predicted lactoylglutathione lyase